MGEEGATAEPGGRPRNPLHPRHAGRRRALDVLYQADVTDSSPSQVLREWADYGEDVPPFARELVEGVEENLAELDRLIAEHSEGWTVARMAVVDRTILRLACYELLHRPDVPVSAAISEAVEAATELSTADSGRFVNGILGKIARERAETETPSS
ncbi:MAG: transcription antitermination factor NusB [Actinomycetota bacterium]|nr:transcription antitermination factor NusB [Actinomycetota bacterium]